VAPSCTAEMIAVPGAGGDEAIRSDGEDARVAAEIGRARDRGSNVGGSARGVGGSERELQGGADLIQDRRGRGHVNGGRSEVRGAERDVGVIAGGLARYYRLRRSAAECGLAVLCADGVHADQAEISGDVTDEPVAVRVHLSGTVENAHGAVGVELGTGRSRRC
jgi:hypothetical protein